MRDYFDEGVSTGDFVNGVLEPINLPLVVLYLVGMPSRLFSNKVYHFDCMHGYLLERWAIEDRLEDR
jgi:hypothetical protein